MGKYFGRNTRELRKDAFKSNKEATTLTITLSKSPKEETAREFLSPDILVHISNEISDIFSSLSSGGPGF